MNDRNTRGSRRAFLQNSGAVAAGLYTATTSGAGARTGSETLALSGGTKAVTYPEDLHRDAFRWPRYGPEEEAAVLDVLRKPGYGPNAALERDWKTAFGAPYTRAFCHGTSAITAMFFALDLPRGSEIMVPSYTFFASIVPMRLFGLVPVFVDINPRTLNFDVEDARRRLTRNTRAMFPVHWFGLPCDMDDIDAFAQEKGLIVLEDAAHAPGTSLKGKFIGNWSRMAIFSYQLTKPMPGIEGGMGVYRKRDDYERATAFGASDLPAEFPKESAYRKYVGTSLGMKLRMHPMAAALARVLLRKLPKQTAEGVAQVRALNDRLIQLPGLAEQRTRPDAERLYYSTNMLFLDEGKAGVSRAEVVKALQAEGVRASAYSYRLQHKCPLYHEAQWWDHLPVIPDLPGCEEANRTAISLPYFTTLVPELVEQYARAFEKVWAHRTELKPR
jgi:dTDP-4-amino-4,6-dideoxygalactose transaminase